MFLKIICVHGKLTLMVTIVVYIALVELYRYLQVLLSINLALTIPRSHQLVATIVSS